MGGKNGLVVLIFNKTHKESPLKSFLKQAWKKGIVAFLNQFTNTNEADPKDAKKPSLQNNPGIGFSMLDSCRGYSSQTPIPKKGESAMTKHESFHIFVSFADYCIQSNEL